MQREVSEEDETNFKGRDLSRPLCLARNLQLTCLPVDFRRFRLPHDYRGSQATYIPS